MSADDQPAEMRAAAAVNAGAKSVSRARIGMSELGSLYNPKIGREPVARGVRREGPGCHPTVGPLDRPSQPMQSHRGSDSAKVVVQQRLHA